MQLNYTSAAIPQLLISLWKDHRLTPGAPNAVACSPKTEDGT
jgi:hypothetical protein